MNAQGEERFLFRTLDLMDLAAQWRHWPTKPIYTDNRCQQWRTPAELSPRQTRTSLLVEVPLIPGEGSRKGCSHDNKTSKDQVNGANFSRKLPLSKPSFISNAKKGIVRWGVRRQGCMAPFSIAFAL